MHDDVTRYQTTSLRQSASRPGSMSAVEGAVERMLPAIGRHVSGQDRDRRLAEPVVDALRATGINRLFLPGEFGGIDAGVARIMDVVERIAAVDGSTAWCAVIGAGSNLFAGYLPREGARRVFGDPDQPSATMLAPAGTLTAGDRGGLRLSGRWPFASNCLHSRWIGLGVQDAGRGPDQPLRVAFVPVADLTIDETWDSDGLRATGSHHVRAADLPVGADRICTFNGPAWPDERLWRMPIATVYLPLLAAVALGIARGALDDVARQATEGRSARRGQVADDPISLAALGVADMHLRAAAAGVRAALLDADRLACSRRPIDRQLQARVCLAAQVATDMAVEATSVAHQIGGGSAAYRGSPLLRALADVQAARQHLLLAHQHRGELERASLGLDVRYPPFVM